MKNIVITGSTRGIGFGLADAFLDRGCAIVISGRSQPIVEAAVEKLQEKHPDEKVAGFTCDVRSHAEVESLWRSAKDHLGRIDIWINNAGYSGPQETIWKVDPEIAQAVIETNLLGVIYGSTIAAAGMLGQGSGCIYNMEGMGSDGRKLNGLAYYGTSKYAVRYYTDCLVKELKDTPLVIGALRPGMVITDMILDQYIDRPDEWRRVKKIFNIIADRVENVAPWLADRILANRKSGLRLNYTSSLKIFGRMLVSPFSKRNIFD